jgi:putative ABC transport system permease protein
LDRLSATQVEAGLRICNRVFFLAQTRDVLDLVVNQGMKPVVIGLAIGIAAAFALGRLLALQLYEVSARNPALLGSAPVLLTAISLMAEQALNAKWHEYS